jgi:hypothetical protein
VSRSQAGVPARGWLRAAGRAVPALGLLVASVAISLAAAEGALRALGYQPFVAVEQKSAEAAAPLSSTTQFDPELGWVLRPSSVVEMWNGPMSVWADSTRVTRPVEHTGAPTHAAVLGCSYTQGPWLADNESLGWLLQQRLPLLDVRSYATEGYGSYQSLLALRRHFARAKKPTSVVIYALGSFHGIRDRASRSWVADLKSRGRLVAFIPPHADADRDGVLAEFPSRQVESWRISEISALAHLVQKAYVSQLLVAADEPRNELRTQLASIRTMHDLSRQNGARFLVAVIFARDEFKKEMLPRLSRHRIEYADCSPATVPAAHPDAFWTYRHAACIRSAVARLAGKGPT